MGFVKVVTASEFMIISTITYPEDNILQLSFPSSVSYIFIVPLQQYTLILCNGIKINIDALLGTKLKLSCLLYHFVEAYLSVFTLLVH